jgi:hypothetical protein
MLLLVSLAIRTDNLGGHGTTTKMVANQQRNPASLHDESSVFFLERMP